MSSLIVPSALRLLDEDDRPGQFWLVEELTPEQQRELNLKPPSPSLLRTGVARDWPDARAVWSVGNYWASIHESVCLSVSVTLRSSSAVGIQSTAELLPVLQLNPEPLDVNQVLV